MFNTLPANPFPPSSEQMGAGGGGSYELPVASAETLGGVKVGNNLSIDGGVLSAPTPYTPPDYSTTEYATGKKWIDGKDIYAIVVNCGALPNNTTKSVETGINPDTVVNVRGVAFDNDYLLPMPYFAEINVYFNRTDNTLYFVTQKDMSDYTNCYMFIEYTKTESEE